MSNSHFEELLRSLPQVLKDDKSLNAFAQILAKQLDIIIAEATYATIYARIDELPEEVLDVLAYDFKVDWWDYRFSLEQKRQTLKDSFLVHKRLGTKFAVETAVSGIYPNSKVEEWFEYGGQPYTFRLNINTSGAKVEPEFHSRVLELANYYKNLRSHLCGFEYIVEGKEPAALRMGGQLGSVISIGIPLAPDSFEFKGSVHMGGSLTNITTIQIPQAQ